jgi:hypothetical protein
MSRGRGSSVHEPISLDDDGRGSAHQPISLDDSAAVIARLLDARLTLHERMGLPTTTSAPEVEKQFRRLSILCHPDKSLKKTQV